MPCKDLEARRKYGREWKTKRREAWFAKNGPCIRCGSWVELELDHKDPKQKINHRVWSWAEERRTAELAKCQALCKPCHKIKTAQDKWDAALHGTHSKWNAGCRCESCRQAHYKYNREWKRGRVVKE